MQFYLPWSVVQEIPTEFMKAKELAATGEATALEQIPKIKRLLTRLGPQLFRASADEQVAGKS